VLNVGIPGEHAIGPFVSTSPHMCGRLKALSNTFRSYAIVSLPYESTIAIV
jgi:hypothetical protein